MKRALSASRQGNGAQKARGVNRGVVNANIPLLSRFFVCLFFFLILRRMGKIKALAPTLPRRVVRQAGCVEAKLVAFTVGCDLMTTLKRHRSGAGAQSIEY